MQILVSHNFHKFHIFWSHLQHSSAAALKLEPPPYLPILMPSYMSSLGSSVGDCRAALQVFNEMLTAKCNPNVVTFTAIINACGRGGNVEEAQTIFEAMKEFGVKPNVMTYNAMIDVYRKHGEHKLAQLTFQEMIQAGLQPTNVSFTCLMSSFKAAGAYDEVCVTNVDLM